MRAKELKIKSFTIIATVLIICAGILFYQLSKIVSNSEPETYVNYGWDLTYHDKSFSNIALADFDFEDLFRGEKIILSIPMVEFKGLFPVLVVHSDNYFFEVQKNGKTFFSSFEGIENRDFIGRGVVFVPINNVKVGEELKIIITVGENNAFKRLTPFRIISATQYYKDIFCKNFYVFVCVHFVFITGLLGIVIGTVLKVLKRKMGNIFLLLGIFSIFASNVISIESQIMSLFINSVAQLSQMLFVSVLGTLICLFLLIYFQLDKYSLHRKILLASIFGIVLISIFVVFMHAFDILSTKALFWSIRIVLGFVICYALFLCIEIIKNEPLSKCLPIFGCCTLFIFFIFDQFLYFVSYHTIGSFVRLNVTWVATGIVLVILCTIISQILYINLKEYNLISKSYAEQSVYKDFITDLYTRTKAVEILQNLEKSGKNYSIVWIDIANLPPNSNLENAENANKMLKTFSEIVKHISIKEMDIARFDTARFLFISSELNEKKIRHFLFVLQGMVNAENSHSEMPITLAGGYAFSKDSAEPNFQSVLRLASQQNVLPIKHTKSPRLVKA